MLPSAILSFPYPGIIYLTSTLSHLEPATLFLVVCAQDGGGLTAAVNADVTVHIVPTTLAPAGFERPKYTFLVYEDVPEGSSVGTVKAREALSKYIIVMLPQSPSLEMFLSFPGLCSLKYKMNGEAQVVACSCFSTLFPSILHLYLVTKVWAF
jgi:hypothetical protein